MSAELLLWFSSGLSSLLCLNCFLCRLFFCISSPYLSSSFLFFLTQLDLSSTVLSLFTLFLPSTSSSDLSGDDFSGFNPMWEETLVFTVHMPELALVRFLVWDHDPIGQDFIGQRTIAFNSMMPGKTPWGTWFYIKPASISFKPLKTFFSPLMKWIFLEKGSTM